MYTKLMAYWKELQAFADLSGDVWMGLLTATIVVRYIAALFGKAPMTTAEAAIYASAVTCFAYSNVNKQ